MQDINLKEKMIEFLGKKKYSSRSRGTLWPSEASAEFVNSFGEREVVGTCKRAIWYRRKGFTESNPPGPKSQVIFMLGNLIEEHLAEIWKRMGLFEASSVRWENKAYNISGEIDTVLNYQGRLLGVECFHPDTKVLMANGTLKKIAQLEHSDVLIDKDGKEVFIKNIQQREKNVGEMGYKIITDLNPSGFIASPNHKIWVMGNGTKGKFVKASKLEEGMYLAVPIINSNKSKYKDEINLWEDLTRVRKYYELDPENNEQMLSLHKDRGGNSSIAKTKIKLDKDCFRFLGVIASLGKMREDKDFRQKYFSIFLPRNELMLVTKILFYYKANFGDTYKIKEHEDGREELILYSPSMCSLIEYLEIDKPVTETFIDADRMNEQCLKAFIEGYAGQNFDYELGTYGSINIKEGILPRAFSALTKLGITPIKTEVDSYRIGKLGEEHIVLEWTPKINAIFNDTHVLYPILEVKKVPAPNLWINIETTGSSTYLAEMFGVSNCKSFYGYHANKQILGHFEGRGNQRIFIKGKPKDSHLMQAAIYAYETKESLEGFKLFYASRDDNDFAEFNITTDQEGNIFVDGIRETRFKIQDIYNRFKYVDQLISTSSEPPERDYTWKPTTERITALFERGDISKSAYKDHIEGKEAYTVWQCNYCQFQKLCHEGV